MVDTETLRRWRDLADDAEKLEKPGQRAAAKARLRHELESAYLEALRKETAAS